MRSGLAVILGGEIRCFRLTTFLEKKGMLDGCDPVASDDWGTRTPSAEPCDSLHASITASLRDAHVLERAPTGCQSFFYRVNAEYDLHAVAPMLQETAAGKQARQTFIPATRDEGCKQTGPVSSD